MTGVQTCALPISGVAFSVGALSNVYFSKYEVVKGKLLSTTEEKVVAKADRTGAKTVPCKLLHIDTNNSGVADTHIVLEGIGKAAAIMPKAQVTDMGDGNVEVRPNATAFTRSVALIDKQYAFNSDSIIPIYITSALPKWFSLVFLLTLLAAAMSTLSSQFHTMGTGIGRDVWEQLTGSHGKSISVTRIGIIIGIIIAVILSHYARGGYIIARATAIFFGLCASAFLPAFIGGLFFKRVTKSAAVASMIVGFVVTAFWLLLVKGAEADAVGLVYKITGDKNSILAAYPNWPNVDPLVIALPLSLLTMIVVSMFTKAPEAQHVARCFAKARSDDQPQPVA